jgi:hypothetical protein
MNKNVTLDNVKEVLNTEIVIAFDADRKLVYNPWEDDYIVTHNGEVIIRVVEVETALAAYNLLRK